MQLGLCCCGDIQCMGCRVPRSFDISNVQVTFDSAFAWALSSASCSYTGYDIIQYSADPADISTTIQLRKRSTLSETGYGYNVGAGLCQWLWNKPTAVESLYHLRITATGAHPYFEGTITELNQYEPLNATDSTSPWNRSIATITDATCGTCVWTGCTAANDKWKCLTGVYYNHVTLWYQLVSTVPTWMMYVQTYMERSVSGSFTNNGAHPIGSNYNGAGGGSCGGYGGSNVGALARATYSKAVNCSTDFRGNAIVLPFISQVSGTPYTSYASQAEVLFS